MQCAHFHPEYSRNASRKNVNFLTFVMLNVVCSEIDKVAVLKRSWLAGMSDEIVREAAACATVRTVADGTLIHARGADGDGFYTVAKGAVRFSRTTADGRATTIAVVEAPHGFGEISVFDGLPRTHDAHAAGPTVLLFHAKTDFKRLLLRHPIIYERFARMLSLRIRSAFDMVEEAAVAPLAQRLARRLLELAHIKPSATDAAASSQGREIPLTQEELGHLLGKSRQSIAKLLREWEQDGLVQTNYGRVSITQPEPLMRIAHPDRNLHSLVAEENIGRRTGTKISKESK